MTTLTGSAPTASAAAPAAVILGDLHRDHALRNAPLKDIGAEYRWRGAKAWKAVLPSFRIARSTYNDLGSAWTDSDGWRATKNTTENTDAA